MISASVSVNSSLLLEPSQTLTFALDPATARTRGARACLTLTNISPRKLVVFKVRTTNVDMFMVKPAQGVIEPSGDVPVVIMLLPPACERLMSMSPNERATLIERFLIQSIDRSDDMRGFGVDDLAAFWKRLPKELITNKKLTCRFIEARDGDPTVHLPLHRLRLPPDEPVHDPHAPMQQQALHRQAPAPVVIPPVPVPMENLTSPEPHPPAGPLGKPGQKPNGRKLSSASAGGNSIPTPQPLPRPPSAPVMSMNSPPQPAMRQPAPPSSKPSPPKRPPPAPQRTPPIIMNMPSSPVPSLRPKPPLFTQTTNESNDSSDSNNQDERISNGSSNDSYSTKRVNQIQFEEHIQTEDVLEFRLHPSESLLFPVHHTYPDDVPNGIVEGKSYFFITNKAHHSGLAFKIKTSNHVGYFVKPARGFIDAKSAVRVDVFVNAPDATRFSARDREMKDRFLVEMLFIGAVKSGELLALPEDRKRQELQTVWEESKAADRRQAVLTCQILEEDSPIDPTHQTAEQARALLQKSQVATTLSFNNHSPVPRDSSGEAANAYVHQPVSPVMHTPRGSPYPDQQYQYQQQQYNQQPQVRSPVMYQSKSPVMQQPQVRSPVMHQVKSPMIQQARSPVMYQSKSPVKQQPRSPMQQPYYGGVQEYAQRPNMDDHRTYYA